MALGNIWDSFKEKSAGCFEALRGIANRFSQDLEPLADRILGCIPEGKRVPVLVGAGATVLLLIGIAVIILDRSAGTASEYTLNASRREAPIPADELFFPEEPVFLPEFLPGQEKRLNWTAEDVAPFWKNPLDGQARSRRDIEVLPWREEMGSVIDKLLEPVP
jgi:hypothetical protein